jgi:hypothetical protein
MRTIHRVAIVTGLLAGGFFVADTAQAQIAISPWFVGGGSYGGGTADGNFMFGAAQVIRAQGDYNALTTQGMINFEMARSGYIDNAVKWSQFYSRMREANEVYKRQKLEQNRHSPEVLAKVAASDVPRALNSDELDAVTGRINWPEVLMDDQYAALRSDLEHLFQLRAWTTTRTTVTGLKIHEDTRQLLELLRRNIENMPASDYIAARKFIDALDYSANGRARPSEPPAPDPTRG